MDRIINLRLSPRVVSLFLAVLASVAGQSRTLAETPVESINLEARDPVTDELISAGGPDTTSWPVGVPVRLRATLSEDRPAGRPITFRGWSEGGTTNPETWSEVGYTTAAQPRVASVLNTTAEPGYIEFNARDFNEIFWIPDTVSNTVAIVNVGIDRIILDTVTPEETGGCWVARKSTIRLRAVPVPEGANFPLSRPDWTVSVQPVNSNLPEPTDGEPTTDVKPEWGGDYTIVAACGTSIKTFSFITSEAKIQRRVAGTTQWWDLNDDKRNVLIGTQINLKVIPSLPYNVAVTGYRWTLGGVHFGDWTSDQTTGTLTPAVTAGATRSDVTYYWTNPGSSRPVVAALTLTNGKKFYVGDVFDVLGPTVDFDTDMGHAQVNDVFGYPALILYGADGVTHGIVFRGTVTMPPGYDADAGRWNWLQVVKPARFRTLNDGTVQQWSLNGQWALDSINPYLALPTDPYTLDGNAYPTGPNQHSTSDSPHTKLTNALISASTDSDEFIMTIMFRPPGFHSRYVPMESVAWRWKGLALRDPGGWSIQPAFTSQADDPATPTTLHPVWTVNVGSGAFQ